MGTMDLDLFKRVIDEAEKEGTTNYSWFKGRANTSSKVTRYA